MFVLSGSKYTYASLSSQNIRLYAKYSRYFVFYLLTGIIVLMLHVYDFCIKEKYRLIFVSCFNPNAKQLLTGTKSNYAIRLTSTEFTIYRCWLLPPQCKLHLMLVNWEEYSKNILIRIWKQQQGKYLLLLLYKNFIIICNHISLTLLYVCDLIQIISKFNQLCAVFQEKRMCIIPYEFECIHILYSKLFIFCEH